MLSSSSSDDDVARYYDAKANATLTKPNSLPELCEMMRVVEEFSFEKVGLPPVQAWLLDPTSGTSSCGRWDERCQSTLVDHP